MPIDFFTPELLFLIQSMDTYIIYIYIILTKLYAYIYMMLSKLYVHEFHIIYTISIKTIYFYVILHKIKTEIQ